MIQDLLTECGRLGLLADITGAILIGKSVFFVKNQDIFDTSAGFLGYSYYHTREKIAAKYEAISGSFFLILGFVGQYLSTEKTRSSDISWQLDILFFMFCITALLLVIKVSHRIADSQTKQLVKNYNEKQTRK